MRLSRILVGSVAMGALLGFVAPAAFSQGVSDDHSSNTEIYAEPGFGADDSANQQRDNLIPDESADFEYDAGEPIDEQAEKVSAAADASSDASSDALADPGLSDLERPVGMEIYGVRLRILNKITAKSHLAEVALDETYLGSSDNALEIELEECWQAPSFERPENAARLNVWEQPSKELSKSHVPSGQVTNGVAAASLDEEVRQLIFAGWMFSSSPSLSTVEHPVYDVTVVECLSRPMNRADVKD